MMRKAWGMVAVLGLVGGLAGCAGAGGGYAATSQDALDSAIVEGDAPKRFHATLSSEQSASPADWWNIDLKWDPIDGASGYQLMQHDPDDLRANEEGWVDIDSDLRSESRSTASTNYVGYDEELTFRVRAIFEDQRVSEWSVEQTVEIPLGNTLYEVEGSAPGAFVTYRTPTGTQQAEVALPMTSTKGTQGIWMQAENMAPYISAQNRGDYGSVTCRITLKGVVVSENTSSGAYGIATCSP